MFKFNPSTATAPQIEEALPRLSIAELAALVERANDEYWHKAAPTLPDPLYDRMVEALRRLDPSHALLEYLGEWRAPVGVAGDGSADSADALGAPVRHRRPMLSLQKCYDDQGLLDWARNFEGEILVMPKLDGVACSLRYDAHGSLRVAATRGDGSTGESITANVMGITEVPKRLRDSGAFSSMSADGSFEVRGEVYMPRSAFSRWAETYSNPRNLVAGALKNSDTAKSAGFGLRFFAYDLDGPVFVSEREKFAALHRLGFSYDPETVTFIQRQDLGASYRRLASLRPELDYEIDGVVYRASPAHEQQRLGLTGHHPRWAIAYKFQGESGETTLNDVLWSVSRTGRVTPVALLEPVLLSGAMVSRASLHNLSIFKRLGLTHGARVQVTRRGGVIPMVERVVAAGPGAVGFGPPQHCPACGRPTQVASEKEAEFLYCEDPNSCVQARISTLEHFAKVLELDGFGPKIIELAHEAGVLREPEDYFTLTIEQLASLDRVGTKTATKLVTIIQAKRRLNLPTFLQALGIEGLGRRIALLMARALVTLDAVLGADQAALVMIPGFSVVTAQALQEGLKHLSPRIAALRSHIDLDEDPSHYVEEGGEGPEGDGALTSTALAGKSVLFTGTLERYTRDAAHAQVRRHGGAVASGVSKDLSLLVVGSGRGPKSSKQVKAEALVSKGASIEIIDEQEFSRRIGLDLGD